jgi:hypothetical protein
VFVEVPAGKIATKAEIRLSYHADGGGNGVVYWDDVDFVVQE